jgi:Zn-dependent protease
MFGSVNLLERLLYLIPLILSLTVHEWAHAYSAFRLGDDTASLQGRLTLNPLAHIDPIGTILAPMLGVPFGWAKPVPVVATRFRRDVSMRWGIMITSAAGPLSNLALAIVSTVAFGLLLRFGMVDGAASRLLMATMQVNVVLFIFNLLPIPPLDGSRVADGLIPYSMRPMWEQFTRFSWVALLLVIVVGGRYLAVPLAALQGWLFHLCLLIRG